MLSPSRGPESRRRSVPDKSKKGQKSESLAEIPPEVKDLRACMICSLIKTLTQFEDEGCENCDTILNLAGRPGSAYSYTSTSFEGMISMMEPSTSWVAKWQHIATMKVGVYAVSVNGELPTSLMQELLESGFRYRCRDKTLTPEELAQREREQNGEDEEERARRIRKSRRQRRKKKQEKIRISESSEVGESQETNQSKESQETVENEGSQESQIEENGPELEEEEAEVSKSDGSQAAPDAEENASDEEDVVSRKTTVSKGSVLEDEESGTEPVEKEAETVGNKNNASQAGTDDGKNASDKEDAVAPKTTLVMPNIKEEVNEVISCHDC